MSRSLYSIAEIADIFDRTPAWFYFCEKNNKLTYENGDPINPDGHTGLRKGKGYSLDSVQEIALSLYRNGTLKEVGLRDVIRKILLEREKSQVSEES